MKKSKIYNMLLLMGVLFLTLSVFTLAATPSYVGIEANDTYTWETTYDEGPWKDYVEDNMEDDHYSEAVIELALDQIDMNEDIEGIKIVVLDVDDEEKETFYDDGVRIIYNYYMKEVDEDWDLEEEDETFAIWKYDYDVYTMGFFAFDWASSYDKDKGELHVMEFLEGENPWFISTKVAWKEVEEEIEEKYEDDYHYDEVSVKVDRDNDRLEVFLDRDEDDDIEEIGWIIDYDNNGVLEYYEYSYDGEPIVIVQTQLKRARIFIEDNMLWIILGSIGVVAVIVVIVVVIIKKK